MTYSGLMLSWQHSLILGFKLKAFHFYGRSSRAEFWPFYLTSWLCLLLSFLANFIPIVGSLIQAIAVILLVIYQITATIRRLHDLNWRGWWLLIPYLLPLAYFLARQPIYVLAPEQAFFLDILLLVFVGSWVILLAVCCCKGTQGANRFGTDPLDQHGISQDFINPQHMTSPEYLGDPWRKFKAKVDAEKQATQEGKSTPESIAYPTPSLNPTDKHNPQIEQHSSKVQTNDMVKSPAPATATKIEIETATETASKTATATENKTKTATATDCHEEQKP